MNKTDILEVIRKNIIELISDLKPKDITPEDSLRNLGANSIDRADILISTLEELSLRIPLTQFAKLKNISELVDFLYEHLENSTSRV